jgi:hypothetical protein
MEQSSHPRHTGAFRQTSLPDQFANGVGSYTQAMVPEGAYPEGSPHLTNEPGRFKKRQSQMMALGILSPKQHSDR